MTVRIFRLLSLAEGISFLLLLFIAMPLKYAFQMPEYVKVIGMIHGILFILYIIGSYFIYEKLNWSVRTLLIVMLCSVLPFGPFYADKKYLADAAD